MLKASLLLSAALLACLPSFVMAADANPVFTETQREEIESIIKNYLTSKHPEVMAEGLHNLQQHEQENADAKAKAAISDAKDRVYNDTNSPVGGNPKGNVTVVEFFDYQCGYCKMSEETIEKLLKNDKNVKFIYKEFPILGPVSTEASKAALASVKQGKYIAFHNALMGKKEHLSSEAIYAIAKEVGLDVEKLKKDMGEKSIEDNVTATIKLGQDIGVRGTPMFVVGENVYPGALQYEQMKQAVTDARAVDKK